MLGFVEDSDGPEDELSDDPLLNFTRVTEKRERR